MPHRIQPRTAVRHLRQADPVMDRLISHVGSFRLRTDGSNPFASLSRAIIYQQLSGKAAGTIHGRFVALFAPGHRAGRGFTIPGGGAAAAPGRRPGRQSATPVGGGPVSTRRAAARSDPAWGMRPEFFPAPRAVLRVSEERLRSAGLSRQKIAYLRDLAAHFDSGELSPGAFDDWDDEEIIAHLTRVKGIGRWTAEMFLIFHLGRPDVLPVGDLGINRAIMKQYRLRKLPTPDRVRRIGAPWRPWATVACWYLWRSGDANLPEE